MTSLTRSPHVGAVPRARPALACLALLLAGLLALGACRSAPTPTPRPTPRPTPTPAPSTQRPEEVVAAARQAMLGLGSFHFQLSQTGGGTPIMPGVEVSGAEGDVAMPGQLQAALSATVFGTPITVKMVAAGGTLYVTNPLTKQWQVWTDTTNLLGTFDPRRAIDGLLARIGGLNALGIASLDGVTTYQLGGTVDASVLATLVGDPHGPTLQGGTSGGTPVKVTVFVGQADSLVHQVQIQGRVTATEKEGIVRVLRLSQFNQPVTIAPPIP